MDKDIKKKIIRHSLRKEALILFFFIILFIGWYILSQSNLLSKSDSVEGYTNQDAEDYKDHEDASSGLKEYDYDEIKLKKAIELDPTNLENYYYLGLEYYKQKRYNDVIELAKETIQINPNVDTPYRGMGHMYYNLGNYTAAESMYKTTLIKFPYDSRSYMGLGWVNLRLERYNESETSFITAIMMGQQDILVRTGLGWAYLFQEKYDFADEQFKIALTLNKNHRQGINLDESMYPEKGIERIEQLRNSEK